MGIRVATADDIQDVARIHKSRFSSHFLGQYSVSLLGKFYAAQLKRSIFLVHEGGNEIDGFILGGESTVLSRSGKDFVISNLCACIWETLWRPRLILAAFGRVRRVLFPHKIQKPPGTRVCLLSVAVDESAAGQGVAVALVDAFEARIRGLCSTYGLSVLKENTRAIRFYEKMGFGVEHEGETSIKLRKRLNPQSLSAQE